MSENERITQLEKEVEDIKKYNERLLKSFHKSFDIVYKDFINKQTRMIGKLATRLNNLESDVKHTTNTDSKSFSEMPLEFKQWKKEVMTLFQTIAESEKAMNKNIEKLQDNQTQIVNKMNGKNAFGF